MRGLGHIPDHDRDVALDLKRKHASRLVGTAPVPDHVDFTNLVGAVFDQGQTSSCVGNAISKSLFMRAAIVGKPIPEVSRKGIYDVARAIDYPYQPLVDVGSRPAAAFLGTREFGVVSEARWPLSEAGINVPPPLDVFESGLLALAPDYDRIPPGAGCATLIRQALGRGFCPTFAMPVDESYQRYDGSAPYAGLVGAPQGGHYQVAAGCVPSGIIVLGSWSSGWGRGGFSVITDAFFDSGAVTDSLVPKLAPVAVS